MKFTLIVNPDKEEEVIMTVRKHTPLCDQIRQLTQAQGQLTGYKDDEVCLLSFAQIQCITVLDGKTFAITETGRFLIKGRLWETENCLPDYFIRINKSAIANTQHLLRFRATIGGGVNAVFRCGYEDYVSRRCFTQIKRRFQL